MECDDCKMVMLNLPPEITRLAQRLAAAQGMSLDQAIQRAIEESARAAGILSEQRRRRRQTVAEMLAVGVEISSMPLLDRRTPTEIMDDIDAL
jgi:antitoxin VapB